MKKYKEALQSNDFLERVDAIEAISPNIHNKKIANTIIQCFEDKNYLVRCEAYDAFRKSSNKEAFLILIKKIGKERSICARMHLISSLCGIAANVGYEESEREYILRFYNKEKNDSVILAYECLLYIYDKNIEHIQKCLQLLNSNNYHIRCNVINILSDVIDKNNVSLIKKAYKKKLKEEDSLAVKYLLENELMIL